MLRALARWVSAAGTLPFELLGGGDLTAGARVEPGMYFCLAQEGEFSAGGQGLERRLKQLSLRL